MKANKLVMPPNTVGIVRRRDDGLVAPLDSVDVLVAPLDGVEVLVYDGAILFIK